MWFSKIHSFRRRDGLFFSRLEAVWRKAWQSGGAALLFFCASILPDALWAVSPPIGASAGLSYAGWPGPGSRGAAWLRATTLATGTASIEMRQTADNGPSVFAPSLSWLGQSLEFFAGSRDVPGSDPVFFSDPALPGQTGDAGSPLQSLPRGRRAPLAFARLAFSPWMPGIWGARSITGPGFYFNMPGAFLAYHPSRRIWGMQLQQRSSRLSYHSDFEGERKEVTGYAWLRLLPGISPTVQDGATFAGARPLLAIDVERSADWDRFRYRELMQGEPYHRYRSWFVSAVGEVGVLQLQVAGQDRGDAAFRVLSVERALPSEEGWYLMPVFRRHALRLYREGAMKEETIAGVGAVRVVPSGAFRVTALAGTGRSLGLEAMASLRIRNGWFDMGVVVAGSEDRDAFLYLPVQEPGQGRSRFYDRATQAAVLRARFVGVQFSLQYGVRRMESGELRQWGYLLGSASRSF